MRDFGLRLMARNAPRERQLAGALMLAATVAAIASSPWDRSFAVVFLQLWLPPAAIAGIGFAVSRREAAATGALLALALFFALYVAWASTRTRPDGLMWLGYFFSLPGGALGSLVFAVIARDYRTRSAMFIATLMAAGTAAGLALNQAVLCATLMHCAL